MNNTKKIATFCFLFLAVASFCFIACNETDSENTENSVNKSSTTYSVISGDFTVTINRDQYELHIVNDTIITITKDRTTYNAPQIIKCDSRYPYTTQGLEDAQRRVEILQDRYNIPCAEYYLCYNKDSHELEYLVLYTTDGPCDWYDNLK
jgi:hypothetical protein